MTLYFSKVYRKASKQRTQNCHVFPYFKQKSDSFVPKSVGWSWWIDITSEYFLCRYQLHITFCIKDSFLRALREVAPEIELYKKICDKMQSYTFRHFTKKLHLEEYVWKVKIRSTTFFCGNSLPKITLVSRSLTI